MLTLLLATVLTISTAAHPVIHQSINVDETRAIHFTSDVNDETAKAFVGQLQAIKGKDPVWVIINSGGGSIVAGAYMENAIDQAKKEHPVYCIAENKAMSMAAGIFEECDKKYMERGSDMMFHTGSMQHQGERLDVITSTAHSAALFDQMDKRNASNLHMDYNEYMAKIIMGGWYLTDEQACEAGAADAIVDGYVSPQAPITLSPPDDDPFKILFGPP